MAKGKKAPAREKSPAVKKTPRARSKSSQSASRKGKSQPRSKSRGRKQAETVARGRSRTRSRSRSRSRSKSKDVSTERKTRGRPRSRLQSPRTPTASRSRGRSRSKPKTSIINELIEIIEKKKPSLSYQEVMNFEYKPEEPKLNEIIRRSISRELSQEKTNMYRIPMHTSALKNLKEVEPKDIDGMSKETALSLPKKKYNIKFSFSIPESVKALLGLTLPPLIVLVLHLACNRNQCTVSKFHLPRNWKYFLNVEAFSIVGGFIALQTLLSVLPFGKKVDGPPGINGTLQYRCNGLMSTLLSVAIVAALWHYKFPVTIVYDKLISILVSSILFAYVLGLLLFIKGGKAPVPGLNPAGIVGTRLYQFYVGREVNPLVFKKINVKTLLVKTCLIGMLLINGLLALKAYEAKHELTNALGTCVVLNALIVLDFFWFENSFPQTFEAMYEGTGCNLTLSYLLYPFLSTLVTKYIIQNKIEVPVWGSVAIIIGFLIGFVIYRGSNSQKATFRKSPLNTVPTQMEAISTNRGKKLLVAGWWGWVRHPNYLGSIILHWAWASSAGYNHVIPYLVPVIVTALLVLRAKRVDSFCHQRYQSSWDEYCSRVRYRIFPRVY